MLKSRVVLNGSARGCYVNEFVIRGGYVAPEQLHKCLGLPCSGTLESALAISSADVRPSRLKTAVVSGTAGGRHRLIGTLRLALLRLARPAEAEVRRSAAGDRGADDQLLERAGEVKEAIIARCNAQRSCLERRAKGQDWRERMSGLEIARSMPTTTA